MQKQNTYKKLTGSQIAAQVETNDYGYIVIIDKMQHSVAAYNYSDIELVLCDIKNAKFISIQPQFFSPNSTKTPITFVNVN